ncbi:MAG: zf-TFIIB domain-containing protein [Chlamydiae bacterium]|nr:zf-TFIIB domain-containing protein [Chlamydiota bacterium]MBI3266325.1 zf-TFIIB domain-containing protein [Chlamydiota bacterium]
MNCPKCTGKLQEHKVEDEAIDVCFVCEGIWFDHEELDQIIFKDSKDFNTIGLSGDDFDAKEMEGTDLDLNHKVGKCPSCGQSMKQTDYRKHVLVDVCDKGCGIWLDGGEIHKLRRRGLVDFLDRLKFAFSGESFRTFVGKIRGR